MKRYEDLTIQDDFIFGKVMQNKKLCKELLELILNIEISDIHYPTLQKAYKLFPESKGIRLDVYVEDGQGTIYDVEVQTSNTGNLPKRTRYYQGTLDLNDLAEGKNYNQLRKSIIIFLCTFDLFGKGNHIYTFTRRCKELPELELGDDSSIIILNPYGNKADVSEELVAFLKYLVGGPSTTTYTKQLDGEVEKTILHPEWRQDYMLMSLKFEEQWNLAREEGLAEGIEQGKENSISLSAAVFRAVQNNSHVTAEEIAIANNVSIKEVLEIMKAFGLT